MLERFEASELTTDRPALTGPAAWVGDELAFLAGGEVGLVDPASGRVRSLGAPLESDVEVLEPEPLPVAALDAREEEVHGEALGGGLDDLRALGAMGGLLRGSLAGGPDRPQRVVREVDGDRLAVVSGREVCVLAADGRVLSRFLHGLPQVDGLAFVRGSVHLASADFGMSGGLLALFEVGATASCSRRSRSRSAPRGRWPSPPRAAS